MDAREKILSFIQQNGPSVPTAIAKQLESNSFFASAYLSEIKEQGKIRISSLKLGGSPLYYIPGQEEQLQRFADNLGEKEKRIYDMLNERKVLKDSTLVPVFRAAIRAIKDFAFGFSINNEIFWRWHSLPSNEAMELANQILGVKKEEPKPIPVLAEEKMPMKAAEERKPEQKAKERQETIPRKAEKREPAVSNA